MKITGTRDHIKVEIKGKVAWFDGELGIDGFYADKNSMRWLPPYETIQIGESEREELVSAIIDEVKDYKYKVFFD